MDFIDDILDFFKNLEDMNLRLNYIYTKKNIDEVTKKLKLNERRSAPLDPFTPKCEDISSKLKELANIIHKNNLSLTQEHNDITNKILDELEDIPEKPFQKSLLDYTKENWNKFPHNLKYAICGITTFVIFFIIFSQLLIYFKQEQVYAYALVASIPSTIFILPRIVSERDRKS